MPITLVNVASNYNCVYAETIFITAIMLSRIKLGYPEIRRSLLDIDDQALSIDDLIAISKQLPTSDEVRMPVPTKLLMTDFANARTHRSNELETSRTSANFLRQISTSTRSVNAIS